MAPPPQRRRLEFQSFADVVADAERLHRVGYDRAGNWDLAQVAGHLAAWLSYPMDGSPTPPLLPRMVLAVMRKTVGRRILRKVLATGQMPAGNPTAKESVMPPGGDEAAAVANLRDTAARLEAFTGETKPSPLFGRLSREDGRRLTLIHCAHHLSFLTPKSS